MDSKQENGVGNGNYARRLLPFLPMFLLLAINDDFTERYLTQLQKMSLPSENRRWSVITYGLHKEYGSSESHQRADIDELFREGNRYIVSLINESFLLIELSFRLHANC